MGGGSEGVGRKEGDHVAGGRGGVLKTGSSVCRLRVRCHAEPPLSRVAGAGQVLVAEAEEVFRPSIWFLRVFLGRPSSPGMLGCSH